MSGDLSRYLEQRVEMGEGRIWIEEGQKGQEIPGPRESSAPPAPPQSGKWSKDLPPIPGPGLVIPSPSEDDLFKGNPLAETTLEDVARLTQACTKCGLSKTRTQAVPGEGPADARLMVVGEGPGQTEDETGRPFVGKAGQLLDEILAAIDCPRPTVFIANIVKCRPPSNRKPSIDEAAACVPYLHRQIDLIRPKVLLAMGGTAAESLLGVRQSLGSLRNKVHDFRGIPLVVTYHPAALLRNPHWKRPTWDDVRIARQLLDR